MDDEVAVGDLVGAWVVDLRCEARQLERTVSHASYLSPSRETGRWRGIESEELGWMCWRAASSAGGEDEELLVCFCALDCVDDDEAALSGTAWREIGLRRSEIQNTHAGEPVRTVLRA